jgi:subtilisin family serine protease
LLLAATATVAQVRLPTLPLPSQPLGTLARPLDDVASRTLTALTEVRQLEIDQLVRNNPRSVDRDPHGNPIVRHEVLAWSPSDAALAHARALGFSVAREQSIDSLQVRVVVLSAPDGMSARKALRLLKEADPTGAYDFNHIYLGSAAQYAALDVTPAAAVPAAPLPAERPIRVGLLDTGVNVQHISLASAPIHQWGCGGKALPAAHGTAVASLLIGRAPGFHGVHPDAEMYSADVYCGQPTGGAVDAIVAALGWLVQENVAVINVSLVGPPNFLLEHTVAALIARGFVIVAAVGNDGPAAPPLYPASYPHVVGVTAVDAHHRVLIEAARGPQVMFASPGADMAAANSEGGYSSVRGTSFASPIVAALLAGRIDMPDPAQAAAAIEALEKIAVGLGRSGRDLTYGYGLVGDEYRIDPAPLVHR